MTCDRCPLSFACFSGALRRGKQRCVGCQRYQLIYTVPVGGSAFHFINCPSDGPVIVLDIAEYGPWYCCECKPKEYDRYLPDAYPVLLR